MTVLITLTIAGTDSGPFNLYSNIDGYVTAFESGVPKASLLAGYASSVVPDFTTTIRVLSTGTCTNYIDITVEEITTTTTTIAPTTTTTTTIPCNCYSVENTDMLQGLIDYVDCDGIPVTNYPLDGNATVYICAQIDTIVVNDVIAIITDLGVCGAECPPI
tara:strand:+ start:723 stop:1205 length:483 start_codon:yes stop_codon:yes gene_type:complete